MSRLSAAVACWLLLAASAPAPARAEGTEYGPVPVALATVRGTDEEERLAAAALEVLEREARGPAAVDARLDARAHLAFLGPVGLRRTAERLAAGEIPAALLPHLLQAVASSAHPAADELLSRAATELRAELRMMAADGLGRGRTDAAVVTLGDLARDPVPGVRAAALRSLFALESDAAVAVRQQLPVDARGDLHARRLRWHRVRGRASEALRPMAVETWRRGRTPDERLEAALLLAQAPLRTPLEVFDEIVTELGTDAVGAAFGRLARGVARRGYDPLRARTAAILAAWMAAHHPDADEVRRRRMVDRAVGWLAQPVRSDPFATRPIPENILRMVLPDLGAAVREPTLVRLREGRFRDPQDGIALLLEALEPEAAREALSGLLDPAVREAVPTPVRVAAAGGLRTLGRVSDEALARALLRPGEEAVIRRDVLNAVGRDAAPWVVGLLGEIVAAEDAVLAPTAIALLERRAEPAARALLVDHLFRRAKHLEVRMRPLVEPADELAYAVLERALGHANGPLRRAALRQLHQVPSLASDRSRALLRAYEVRARERFERTHEWQQVLYAWFALLPGEAVPFLRERWAEFGRLDWQATVLKSLQNLRAEEADAAVIDFVLEKIEGVEDPVMLQQAATGLEGRRGRRDADLDAFWRRLLTHPDESVVFTAVRSLEHPGRGDLTDLLLPMLEGMRLGDPDALGEPSAILEVLDHQPWPRVEAVAVRLVLDVGVLPPLRRQAALLLLGRPSPDARARLLGWLTDPESAAQDLSVQQIVARVVGAGGGAREAEACYAVLVERLGRAFAKARDLDPDEQRDREPAASVAALATAIAYAGHEPTMQRIVALLFTPSFARYARRAVERQGLRLAPADATASARPGPTVNGLWLRAGGPYHPMPYEVSLLVESMKPMADEALARCFEAVLATEVRTGRLAAFPELYLDRVIAGLRDRPTGDRRQAAAIVEAAVDRLPPAEGVVDFVLARAAVEETTREGRFADAADAQRRVVRILARRAYDDEPGWNWRTQRAAFDALEAAAAAAAGADARAGAGFTRAVAWNVYDATILQTTARLRALADFGLDEAVRLALRAATLEQRVHGQPSLGTGDTLALLFLKLDRPAQAVDAIEQVLGRVRPYPHLGGRYHLRHAQALAGVGDLDAASQAVLDALAREPTLNAEMRDDPFLSPLRQAKRLEALIREAEERALEPLLD